MSCNCESLAVCPCCKEEVPKLGIELATEQIIYTDNHGRLWKEDICPNCVSSNKRLEKRAMLKGKCRNCTPKENV